MTGVNLAAMRAQYTNPDIRPAAKAAQADVIQLLNYIGELEETVLAAGQLLTPVGEDWGPEPPHAGPGRNHSYESYLSEGFFERAQKIRDQWKARGWRRG